MAKFFGAIGYAETKEVEPGKWKDIIVERFYYGDIVENTSSRWSPNTDSTNDDITITNQISIVADPFAYQNFHKMKYIEFMGARWKIDTVKVLRPRLIMTTGGLYNGPTLKTS